MATRDDSTELDIRARFRGVWTDEGILFYPVAHRFRETEAIQVITFDGPKRLLSCVQDAVASGDDLAIVTGEHAAGVFGDTLTETAVVTAGSLVAGAAAILLELASAEEDTGWLIRAQVAERAEALDRERVARWMAQHAGEHATPTELAEAAAEHFGVNDEGGPLDDPEGWIWDVAREARERWDSEHSDQADDDE
jgi:hypothetical protein